MRQTFILLFFFTTYFSTAQNSIDWDKDYQLQFSDFQSTSTQIGGTDIYSLYTGVSMEFSFYMSSIEFMFTKNFNSKVICSFNKSAASLISPDSLIAIDLLNFSRYDFDLSELYARKFRKRLLEEKGTFSEVRFFKPVYDKIQEEFVERHANAAKTTDLGRNRQKLKELHNEVLKEIDLLSEFCKICKPQKTKK